MQTCKPTKLHSVKVWLPENILQHILRQRRRVEHDKQALPRLAVRRRKLLRGRQGDVCLNPRCRRRSREGLGQDSEQKVSQQLADKRQKMWRSGKVLHRRLEHLAAGRTVPHCRHHLSGNKLHGHPTHRAATQMTIIYKLSRLEEPSLT